MHHSQKKKNQMYSVNYRSLFYYRNPVKISKKGIIIGHELIQALSKMVQLFYISSERKIIFSFNIKKT